MADEPIKTCPFEGCKGRVTRLMSSGAGVIFKGSGFYQTDYKKSGSPANACPAAESKSCPKSSECPAANSSKD